MDSVRVVHVILLSACLWKMSITGSITFCRDKSSSFENGTSIPAILGQPVSVVFCVQCQMRQGISPYIKIEHPVYITGTGYYNTLSKTQQIKGLEISMVRESNKAFLNITINNVTNVDLAYRFSVRLHASTNINDNIDVFFYFNPFVISNSTPSDVSTAVSTETATSPVTWTASSSTDLSSVTFPEATVSMTPLVSTECWSDKPSQCPENWYQVNKDTCLLITFTSGGTLPRNKCDRHSADPVKRSHLNIFGDCLMRILQATWRWNIYVIRLNQTHYFNVQSGEYTTSHMYFNVVCMKTLEPPTVTNFSVKMYHENKWNYVDNSTEYLTINKTYTDVKMTCQADGFPEPDVTITDTAQKHIKSDQATRIYCNEAGVFTCTANNSVGSVKSQRRIQIFSPIILQPFTVTRKPPQSEIRSGDSVQMVCSFVGCLERVAITFTRYLIAETTNSALTVSQRVNCSHMGTYTCLAKSQSGQVVTKSAELELKGCPVSMCHSEKTSQEMSPALGENVTFSLCLMSSEELKHLTSEPGIFVTLTRNSITGFYWTANITMYNIQQHDYRTHTVRIRNSDGSLDFRFTLNTEKNFQEYESEFGVLLETILPVCVSIIVIIIIVSLWYGIKAMHANIQETSPGRCSQGTEDDQERSAYLNVVNVGTQETSLTSFVRAEKIVGSCSNDNDRPEGGIYSTIEDALSETVSEGEERNQRTYFNLVNVETKEIPSS